MAEAIAPRYYRFLQLVLQQAEQEALISEQQSAQILSRYQAASTRFWQVLLFVLAAALVGGGIILLLAHNWADLSRPVRAVLSYVPLALSYATLLAAYSKEQAAKEGAGAFHALALIAALALIGQTYHSGGDVWDLLRNSAILLLPVALLYPAQSSACAFILFVAGLLFQNILMTTNWLLAAASGILLWRQRGSVLAWFVALFAFLLLMRLLFDYMDEVAWQAVYVAVSLYYVLGRVFCGQDYARNPLASIGAAGILLLALLSAWDDRGLFTNNFLWGIPIWVAIFVYLAAGLAVVAVVLAVQKRLRFEQAAFAALLPLMLFANYWLQTSDLMTNTLANKGFLLMSFTLGLCLAIVAERQQRWLKFNAALLLLCNALAAAFFDEMYSFMLRGIVFIIIGLILLFANLFLMKKRKAA